MKKVALIIMVLWTLLIGGVWAAEKDCGQEVKVEVGGRYLVEIERTYNANILYVYSTPQSYVTSIQIKEISNSGKYASWWEFGFYDNYEFRSLDTRWPRQQIIGHSLPGTLERVWRPPEEPLY